MMKSLWSFDRRLLPPCSVKEVSSPPLNCAIAQTFIVACNEPTQQLESTLQTEGLPPHILRQQSQPEYQHYARSTLALLNHRRAWQQATQNGGLTLIVEADFVPVRGMGRLPLPFAIQPNHSAEPGNSFDSSQRSTNRGGQGTAYSMAEEGPVGIGWLYTCAAQIYSVAETGHGKGFSTSMVAYIITTKSAIALLEMFPCSEQDADPTLYQAWDSQVDQCLRQRGFENFIPFRNYGEHGGRPNPEHKHHGLSATHRADVLYGPLAFTPAYVLSTYEEAIVKAKDTGKPLPYRLRRVWVLLHFRYIWIRGHARLKGMGRLILGRFLHKKIVTESSVPLWLLYFAIRRHFSFYL